MRGGASINSGSGSVHQGEPSARRAEIFLWLVLREACFFRGTLRSDIVSAMGHEQEALKALLPYFARVAPDIEPGNLRMFYRRVLTYFMTPFDHAKQRQAHSDKGVKRPREAAPPPPPQHDEDLDDLLAPQV